MQFRRRWQQLIKMKISFFNCKRKQQVLIFSALAKTKWNSGFLKFLVALRDSVPSATLADSRLLLVVLLLVVLYGTKPKIFNNLPCCRQNYLPYYLNKSSWQWHKPSFESWWLSDWIIITHDIFVFTRQMIPSFPECQILFSEIKRDYLQKSHFCLFLVNWPCL